MRLWLALALVNPYVLLFLPVFTVALGTPVCWGVDISSAPSALLLALDRALVLLSVSGSQDDIARRSASSKLRRFAIPVTASVRFSAQTVASSVWR